MTFFFRFFFRGQVACIVTHVSEGEAHREGHHTISPLPNEGYIIVYIAFRRGGAPKHMFSRFTKRYNVVLLFVKCGIDISMSSFIEWCSHGSHQIPTTKSNLV